MSDVGMLIIPVVVVVSAALGIGLAEVSMRRARRSADGPTWAKM